ncbi:MAG: hypothetical protein JWQ64_3287 [Subtercola sp.]|jgi:uncharacterized membrane protein|nr:hypothetical protein [Subtercola sp.]
MMPAKPSLLDRFYFVAVIIKGIDGVGELVAGVLLWLAPQLVHFALAGVVNEAQEGHTAVRAFVADNVARLDAQLAQGGTVFLIVFLIVHGVVKIALVYCLIKRFHRAYPWALGVLIAFLGYQIYAFITTPTVSMALFTVLDAVIIYLVWREYRELLSQQRQRAEPADPVTRPSGSCAGRG